MNPGGRLAPAVMSPGHIARPRGDAPGTMSYAEFRDSERTLVPAMLIPSLILPGTLHMMAGEAGIGWINAGIGVSGIGLIAGGAADGNRVAVAARTVAYVGGLLYDWVHGAKVIEEKRTRVRFKYGL